MSLLLLFSNGVRTGSAAVSLGLSLSASGTVRVVGTGGASFGLGASASGVVPVTGAGTAAVGLGASASGTLRIRGTGFPALGLSTQATGTVTDTGALVGQHQINLFPSPTVSSAPVDANVVRGNDNTLVRAFNAHDADASIHMQSGLVSQLPATAPNGATYFCVDTQDTYSRVEGVWVQSSWAHWYIGVSDTTDQTHVSINTPKVITFTTVDVARGVSLVSASRLKVTYAGTYNLMWSGQFTNSDSQLQDVDVWVRINGVDMVGSTGQVSVPNKHGAVNGHVLPAWNYFITLAPNDYVELFWSVSNTAVKLSASPASAWAPSTASVIATLNRV